MRTLEEGKLRVSLGGKDATSGERTSRGEPGQGRRRPEGIREERYQQHQTATTGSSSGFRLDRDDGEERDERTWATVLERQDEGDQVSAAIADVEGAAEVIVHRRRGQ